MAKKMTRKNADKVLARIGDMIRKDKDIGGVLLGNLNEMLNRLCDSDLFGTEGQLDPRGDNREEA